MRTVTWLALALVPLGAALATQGDRAGAARASGIPPIDGDIMAAASKARPPQPVGNQSDWFPNESYPPAARRAMEQGRVSVVVQVDATGRPGSCAVTSSSGSASLDRVTCELAMRNARFRPALDAQGRAVAAPFTMRNVAWILGPPGYDVGDGPVVLPMPTRLVTDYDEQGRITGCYTVEPDGSPGQPCPREMIGKPGGPVATRDGVPVPGRMIQEMRTTLEARPAAAPR